MSAEKATILPNAFEMSKRLMTIKAPSHIAEKFHPLLLKHAETEKTAGGVAVMFTLAIVDYANGNKLMRTILYMVMPRYVDALVGDVEIASKVKRVLEASK